MHPTVKAARVAGLLYVLACIPAPFSLVYVPSTLIVRGNATATANKILASESMLRLGMAGELINSIAFIFVVLALYRLFEGVNKRLASLMVTLFVVSVPISCLNVLNEIAALTLVRGADFLSLFDKSQRDALAMLFLGLHDDGIGIAAIFWGLWLFPFGILVMRSGFIPRILGVLLILGGFAYPAVTLASLLFPSYPSVVNQVATILEALGEGSIVLWLLIKGAKVQPLAAAA